MKKNIPINHPVRFAFVDETGITLDPRQPYFGIGAFITIRNELSLNQKLRNVFLEAVNHLRQTEETFEFKFTYITPNSLPFYKKLISLLSQHRNNWEFRCAIREQKNHQFWNQYLDMITQLFPLNDECYIIIADYVNKPKRAGHGLVDLIRDTSILKVLQIESQGSVFLQIADVLLGGLSYQISKGQDKYKQEISDNVIRLLNKKRAGIDPIYAAQTPETMRHPIRVVYTTEKNKSQVKT